MHSSIRILPTRHLLLDKGEEGSEQSHQEKALHRAFEQSPGDGLFALAVWKAEQPLPACCGYWRDFAGKYLSTLCHSTLPETVEVEAVPPPGKEELGMWLLNLPAMTGAEYVDLGMLTEVWQFFDEWIRNEVQNHPEGLGGFLSEKAPLWHRLGRVSFHLAENKRDSDKPFAFMVTYSRRMSGDGKRVQYLPLKQALKEYAGEDNKPALAKLLRPVLRAAESSDVVARLVDSGQLYQPLAWKPGQAYQLLKEVEAIESSGVLVHLPNWWKKRPKPRVSVNIGGKELGLLSAQSLLDFDVSVTLDEHSLTKADLEELLELGEEGLVQFRGQWVEVDSERLKQALDHWENLAGEYSDGVSFIEGMRMLAGASDLAGGISEPDDEDKEWSSVNAGKWLLEILNQLRAPEAISALNKREGLQANLRAYQEVGANWLNFTTSLGLGACLADDMGLGKTIQVIAHLLECQRRKGQHCSLLVLPTSLLANWTSELDKFAPQLRYRVVHPSSSSLEELETLAKSPVEALGEVDLVLTTYGLTRRQEWLREVEWDLVILDEAQAIKNHSSQQTRAVKFLKAKSRIALTGTPVENRLSDLWSLFDFLNPGLLGSTTNFKGFVKSLEARVPASYAPLRKLVQPYILRRLKTDRSIISDLPDKTEINAHCTLSKSQAVLYQKLVEELGEALNNPDGDPMQRRGLVLAYLQRFKQLCNHSDHYLGRGEYAPKDSGKFHRLKEICDEIAARQEKVLVFTQFREITDPLAQYLAQVFGRPGLILHGGTSVKNRKVMVDDFQQEDGPPFFILSLKAGGVGLNLTAASHVIHFDRWWNPAVENQATDRAFRIGQKRNVLVHKFVTQGTIEEKIDEMIESKKQLAGEILESGGEQILTELSDDELIQMVSLDLKKVNV